MAKFYFRVWASNHATHAYCVEAPDQKTADGSIAEYSDVREWKRIEEKDIPADMTFKPSQRAPAVWEGEN
jgi:hypothetical protein